MSTIAEVFGWLFGGQPEPEPKPPWSEPCVRSPGEFEAELEPGG